MQYSIKVVTNVELDHSYSNQVIQAQQPRRASLDHSRSSFSHYNNSNEFTLYNEEASSYNVLRMMENIGRRLQSGDFLTIIFECEEFTGVPSSRRNYEGNGYFLQDRILMSEEIMNYWRSISRYPNLLVLSNN